jgi:hypothetical protein
MHVARSHSTAKVSVLTAPVFGPGITHSALAGAVPTLDSSHAATTTVTADYQPNHTEGVIGGDGEAD